MRRLLFPHGAGGRRRGLHGNGMTLLLLMQLFGQARALEGKRPVTLALVAVMVIMHLSGELHADAACFSAGALMRYGLSGGVARRLLLAPFVHLDDWHLYYNMGSLLWKGAQLEGRHGSVFFAVQVVALLVLSQAGAAALAIAASAAGHPSWANECAAGFSGVLFALKTLLSANATGTTSVGGLPIAIPARFAAWAELGLIYMLVPRSSFVGHLGGIIGGLAYLALEPTGAFAAVARALLEAAGAGDGGGAPAAARNGADPRHAQPRDAGAGVGWVAPPVQPRRTWGSGTTRAPSGDAEAEAAGEAPDGGSRDAQLREGMRRRYGGGAAAAAAPARQRESDAELAARLQAEENRRSL